MDAVIVSRKMFGIKHRLPSSIRPCLLFCSQAAMDFPSLRRPMRFLIQTPHLSDEISGVQTYVDIMAGALRRASVDVEVISTRNTGWKVLWAAVRRADVVHLNSNHLSLALMARMLKKKLILKYHFEFWMAPVSGDCSALKWPQRLRREIAFRWNQGQGQGLRLSRLRYFCDSAARAILRVGVAALANDRLFCSRALAQSANLPGKSTIAYNPVKVDSEMPTVVRTDPPLFAFVGRIERNKGCDILMNAAAILKTQRPELNFQLVIVGDGPERSMLESQAASMEVDCHFTGRVS